MLLVLALVLAVVPGVAVIGGDCRSSGGWLNLLKP